MFGIKMGDVQSHVDKKISQAHNLIIYKFATKAELQSTRDQVKQLRSKLELLEEYLKIEVVHTDEKGYKKVTKK